MADERPHLALARHDTTRHDATQGRTSIFDSSKQCDIAAILSRGDATFAGSDVRVVGQERGGLIATTRSYNHGMPVTNVDLVHLDRNEVTRLVVLKKAVEIEYASVNISRSLLAYTELLRPHEACDDQDARTHEISILDYLSSNCVVRWTARLLGGTKQRIQFLDERRGSRVFFLLFTVSSDSTEPTGTRIDLCKTRPDRSKRQLEAAAEWFWWDAESQSLYTLCSRDDGQLCLRCQSDVQK